MTSILSISGFEVILMILFVVHFSFSAASTRSQLKPDVPHYRFADQPRPRQHNAKLCSSWSPTRFHPAHPAPLEACLLLIAHGLTLSARKGQVKSTCYGDFPPRTGALNTPKAFNRTCLVLVVVFGALWQEGGPTSARGKGRDKMGHVRRELAA